MVVRTRRAPMSVSWWFSGWPVRWAPTTARSSTSPAIAASASGAGLAGEVGGDAGDGGVGPRRPHHADPEGEPVGARRPGHGDGRAAQEVGERGVPAEPDVAAHRVGGHLGEGGHPRRGGEQEGVDRAPQGVGRPGQPGQLLGAAVGVDGGDRLGRQDDGAHRVVDAGRLRPPGTRPPTRSAGPPTGRRRAGRRRPGGGRCRRGRPRRRGRRAPSPPPPRRRRRGDRRARR